MMFRFPSVICTRCTGFFCLAIIKATSNDIYCIIEEPYKHYFTEKVSYSLIFDKHANLKYKFGNRHFWAEGYYVSTVGLNEATIKKYIQEQEKHDIAMDKLSVKEYEDPFKG